MEPKKLDVVGVVFTDFVSHIKPCDIYLGAFHSSVETQRMDIEGTCSQIFVLENVLKVIYLQNYNIWNSL